MLLAQGYIHIVLLGAFVADDPPKGGFLNGVKVEYFLTAIAANDHAEAHSSRPSGSKEPIALIPHVLPIPIN
jgi:hypothetical protein